MPVPSLTFHKKQIPEVQKLLAKKGIAPVTFDKHQRINVNDRKHRHDVYRCSDDAISTPDSKTRHPFATAENRETNERTTGVG